MAANVVFECVETDADGNETKLNSKKFSAKEEAGYCLAMSIDWARTTLTIGSVKGLFALHPMQWPIVQSAYEQEARLHQPNAIALIEGNGLEITNSDAPGVKGNELVFGGDLNALASQLANLVGTYIIYLAGPPGSKLAHFMGFRRLGAGSFIRGEWFDPNDCLMELTSEPEWRAYLAGMLNHSYKNFTDSCCVCRVERKVASSVATQTAQGVGKDQFAALKNVFERKAAS